MKPVLNLLLTHQPAEAVAAMVEWWKQCAPPEHIVLAYGGSRADFEAIAHPAKVYVDDPRLRTRDHQRERQSYGGVFRAAAGWMRGREFSHVHFAEYDHLPLVADLNQRQLALLEAERADVIGLHLRQVGETNCAHYLYHAADPEFFAFWKKLTCRADPRVVLSMLATGSFWTREAFDAVAACHEPHPMYVEIFLPTAAHHLGFRIRDLSSQMPFALHIGDWLPRLAEARAAGAWAVHPVKGGWDGRLREERMTTQEGGAPARP